MDNGSGGSNYRGRITTERDFYHVHWIQGLLRLVSFLSQCRRTDNQDSLETEADTSCCNSCKVPKLSFSCSICDNAAHSIKSMSNDETQLAELSFLPGHTLDETSSCQLCLDQPDDPRQAQFTCVDCHLLMCHQCFQWHDRFFNDHCVSNLEEDDAQNLAEISRRRIPVMLCRLHNSACDQWCSSCDTAHCPGCFSRNWGSSCSSVNSASELDQSLEKNNLCVLVGELKKVSDKIAQLEESVKNKYEVNIKELGKIKRLFLDALDDAITVNRKALDRSREENHDWIKCFNDCTNEVMQYCRMLTLLHRPASNEILIRQAQIVAKSHLKKAQHVVARQDRLLERLDTTFQPGNYAEIMKRCTIATTKRVGSLMSTCLREYLWYMAALVAVPELVSLVWKPRFRPVSGSPLERYVLLLILFILLASNFVDLVSILQISVFIISMTFMWHYF